MKIGGLPDAPVFRRAILAAGLMMAWQVASKATRDSLFLAVFLPSALPAVIGVSAVCSILMAFVSAKLLARFGPSRLIPSAYLLGGALHGVEWMLLPSFPRAVSALVYVHVIAFGSVLLSGFWALANERFNPREARHRFGQIAAFETVGSVVGGLLAERVASLGSSTHLLALLGMLQLACFLALLRFTSAKAGDEIPDALSIPEVISAAPYLVGLAAFVLLISMSAATLDYLFKFQAVERFGRGVSLGRFFSLFYAATALLTFAIQAGGTRFWLNRFGPGKTVAVLPVAVAGASAVSMFVPGAAPLIISRALQQSLRGSLFLSGYELFFTPMPQAEKRSTKSVIDIGADRLGDGLAAAAIQLFLVLPAAFISTALLALTAVLSSLAAWLAFRLDRAYVVVLEKGLARHTVTITPEEAEDFMTKSIVVRSLMSMATVGAARRLDAGATAHPADPALQQLAELRSGDPARVRAALKLRDPLSPIVVPQVIELLSRDEFARPAHEALCRVADRIAGQLMDCLKDESADFKIRRRIPRILASCHSALAWDGLFGQLRDERFEIRLRCARALEKILESHPSYRPDEAAMFEIVAQELSTPPEMLRQQGSADAAPDHVNRTVDTDLRERPAENLAHIATLLGLVLQQPVRLAFRALRADNAKLRSVAIEYLDSVLPKALWEQLSPHVEAPKSGRGEEGSR